jgi:hypothetical protein
MIYFRVQGMVEKGLIKTLTFVWSKNKLRDAYFLSLAAVAKKYKLKAEMICVMGAAL